MLVSPFPRISDMCLRWVTDLNLMGLRLVSLTETSLRGNSERLMKEASSSFNQALRASISQSQYAELINLGCNYSYDLQSSFFGTQGTVY